MTRPVTYVEINSSDVARTRAFFADTFGWQAQPFVAPDYFVAPHGDGPGVDTGLMSAQDGQPRTIAVIGVESLESTMDKVRANGGTVVVEPFTVPGVGRGAYIVDPTGVLVGLHETNPST